MRILSGRAGAFLLLTLLISLALIYGNSVNADYSSFAIYQNTFPGNRSLTVSEPGTYSGFAAADSTAAGFAVADTSMAGFAAHSPVSYAASDGTGIDIFAEGTYNSAPVLNTTSVSLTGIFEDETENAGTTVAALLYEKSSDDDGNALGIAVISTDKSNGSWQYDDGTGWWSLPRENVELSESNALLLSSTTKIRYLPGANYDGAASITFRVWDGTSGTNGTRADVTVNGASTAYSVSTGTAVVAVNPINDAPDINVLTDSKIVHFDGADDYLSVPDLNLNNSYTVGAWVKAEASGRWARIFDFGGGESNFNQIMGFYDTTGKIYMEIWRANAGYFEANKSDIVTDEVFPLNQWIYVTGVFDKTNSWAYIYWNGVQKASGHINIPTVNAARVNSYFGRSNWSQDTYYKGSMYGISVWGAAHSQAQVQQDMSRNLTGNEESLVAYYPLVEGSGTTTADLAGNDHSGTFNGGLAWADNSGFNYQVSGFTNSDIPIDKMIINDADDAGRDMALILSATHGTLTFGYFEGLAFTAGGNGQTSVTVQGAKASVNAALATLKYRSDTGYTGHDIIAATVSDLGNSGTGGVLTDNASIPVSVSARIVPALSGTIAISGQAACGDTLLVNTSGITTLDFGPFSYSWKRDGTTEVGTGQTYVPAGIDVGHTITVTVTANGINSSGSLTSAPTAAVAQAPVAGSGRNIVFDGSDDFVDVPANTLYDTNKFSVEVWVKYSDAQSWNGIVDKGRNIHENWYILTQRTAAGVVAGIAGGNELSYSWGDNGWHHVCITFDGGTFKLYVDGVERGSNSGISYTPTASSIAFGRRQELNNSWYYYKGSADDIRIWNTARTQQEISDNMFKRLSGDETGLVGYWRMDETDGIVVNDVSGHQNGALSNAAASARVISDAWAVRTTNKNKPLTIYTGYDLTGRILTAAILSGPSHGTLTFNNTEGTAVYIPAANWTGPDSFTYKVTNPEEVYSTYTVNMTTQNIGSVPVAGFGKTVEFNGSNYIEVPFSSSFDITNRFTVEFWFKPANTSQTGKYLISRNLDPGTQWGILYEYTDNMVQFHSYVSPGYDNPGTGSTMPVTDTNWHHIAYSYDGVNWCGYLDGEAVFTTMASISLPSPANNFYIGGTAGPAGLVQGNIDEVRIWRKGLTADTIKNWMYREVDATHPDYAYLADYYKLNEGTGATITDSKGTANGTLKVGQESDWKTSDIRSWNTLEDNAVNGKLVASSDSGSSTNGVDWSLVYSVTAQGAKGNVSIGSGNSFTYTPNPDQNGEDAFSYKAHDGPSASNEFTVHVSIGTVNDPPAFVKGTDQAVSSTTAGQITAGWAGNITAGPADEAGQTLTFTTTNSSMGLFSVQPAIAPDGTLTYTPKPDVSGTATVKVQLQDNGGTANGGSNTSAEQQFTITVDTRQYHVAFDSNGGSSVNSVTAFIGTALSRPADPARTGFTFDGWYLNSSLTSIAVFPYTVAADVTLYAKWNAIPEAGFRYDLGFNGSGYLDCGANNPDLKLGNVFTEEVWIYPTAADTGYHGILGYHDDSATAVTRAPGIWYFDKNKIHVGFGDGTGWVSAATAEPVLTADAWNHVAAVYDGTAYKVYVNGNLVLTSVKNKTSMDTPVRTIGRVDNNFIGQMDEVRLWKTALSQETIRTWMNKQVDESHPAYSDLAGYWTFNENAGSSAADMKKNTAGIFTGSGTAWNSSNVPQKIYINNGGSTPVSLAGYDKDGDALTYEIVSGPVHGAIAGTGSNRAYTHDGSLSTADAITYGVNDGKADSVNTAVIEVIVAKPPMGDLTFTPASGVIECGDTVTIASGTAGAHIHYTTDGSMPATASAVYTAPVVVTTASTIKAFAVKDDYTDGLVAEAAYTIRTHSLTYNANGGTGAVPEAVSLVNGGVSAVAAADTFTRTGYNFTGWNTKADGSGSNYPAGGTFAMGRESITLYAKWEAKDISLPLTVLPAGTYKTVYSEILAEATNGTGAYTYTITAGALPTGLSLSGTTISGMPASRGTFGFSITAADSGSGKTATKTYSITVGSRNIAIRADNKRKTYGDADPMFTYTVISGSMEDGDAITGALARETGENAGTYDIGKGTLVLNDNYNLTFTKGTLTIEKATVTGVTFEGAAYTYDGVEKSLSAGGAVLPDGVTVTYEGNGKKNAGTYTVSARFEVNGNYSAIGDLTAELVINKAPLTVRADNKTKVRGDINPRLTITYTGFVDGETAANITGPAISTAATAGSPAGTYEITLSGGSAANYDITLTNGTLTITAGPETAATENIADILLNGKPADIGRETVTTENGRTSFSIWVDRQKLEQKLDNESSGVIVTLPFNHEADKVTGELNGQTVRYLENKQAVIEIKSGAAAYSLPAGQIDIGAISRQLGSQVALEDIRVQIEISKPSDETARLVENSAKAGKFAIVVPPVEFTVKCTYNDKTIVAANFSTYVERTVEIPDGTDPGRITTGIVVEADGSFRHVPTKIIVIDGKYYARINSLTNSIYSVIWHPVEYTDVTGHWAKEEIDDMGSRYIFDDTKNGMFEPGSSMTRAEFTVALVKALGLKPGIGMNPFKDVSASDLNYDYITTAWQYKLINGYNPDQYAPGDRITREQAFSMIARAMKITRLRLKLTPAETERLLESYSDSPDTESYAKDGISSCIKAGIVSGGSGNLLNPGKNITKAESAVVIRRLLQKSGLI